MMGAKGTKSSRRERMPALLHMMWPRLVAYRWRFALVLLLLPLSATMAMLVPYLSKIADKAKETDAVWMFFSGSAAIRIITQYQEYGLNAVFLENWWNAGSPVAQERYLDNFVISTERIGCGS